MNCTFKPGLTTSKNRIKAQKYYTFYFFKQIFFLILHVYKPYFEYGTIIRSS